MSQSEALGAKLSAEAVYGAIDLNGRDISAVQFSPTGEWISYLEVGAHGFADLWCVDAHGRRPPVLLVGGDAHDRASEDPIERARRERQRVFTTGVSEYCWHISGAMILAVVNGQAQIAAVDAHARSLEATQGRAVSDARFSPSGTFVSFIAEDGLWIAPLQAGDPRRLSPAAHDAVRYGVAEFVAQEEFARDTGYWWSPDDHAIVYARVDEADVDLVERVEIGETLDVVRQRFPRAGRSNASVSLWVRQVDGADAIPLQIGDLADCYIVRVCWALDSQRVFVQVQSRDQKELVLWGVDARNGKGDVLVRERQEPWVNVFLDFAPLTDGGFLWVSERSGSAQLYRYDRDGQLVRQLTTGPAPLLGRDRARGLVGLDTVRQVAFVTRSDVGPLEAHVVEIDLNGQAPPRQLTQQEGQWTATFAPDGKAFIGRFSNPTTPSRIGVFEQDGRLRFWLSENALTPSHPYWPFAAGLPQPAFGVLKAEDGQDLHYVLLKPDGFDPGRRYPVIVQVYGGPGRQHVTKSWRPLSERLFLEAGFVLFQLDNRGACHRGVAFEAPIHLNLGGPEVADQRVGLEFLRAQPWVDPARIGLTGWSYGGFMTLRMMTEPGMGIAAGVAGAAPARWTMYDTHYTERFLGRPTDHPDAYERSSIEPRLANLEGRLLLIHGLADDNVLPENALRLVAALQALSAPFDLMLYPGQRHSIIGTAAKLHLHRTTMEFFTRWLRPSA